MNGGIGARLAPQLAGHGHRVIGTSRSHGNGGLVRALAAGPIALGQQTARGWRRIAGRF